MPKPDKPPGKPEEPPGQSNKGVAYVALAGLELPAASEVIPPDEPGAVTITGRKASTMVGRLTPGQSATALGVSATITRGALAPGGGGTTPPEGITYMPPATSLTNHEGVWTIAPGDALILNGTTFFDYVDLVAQVGDQIMWRRNYSGNFWMTRHYVAHVTDGPPPFTRKVYIDGAPYGATVEVDPAPQFLSTGDDPYIGPSNTPTQWELHLTDSATIAALAQHNMDYAGTWPTANPYNKEFLIDATYGFPYMRFTNPPNIPQGPPTMLWYLPAKGQPHGGTNNDLDRMYCRYLLWLEDDVEVAWNEWGLKLSGLSHYYPWSGTPGEQTDFLSWVNIPAANSYGLCTYSQIDAMGAAGYQSGHDTLKRMKPGRWYVIELGCQHNSAIGVADGWFRMWVNGHITIDKPNIITRGDMQTKFREIHAHVYHGGQHFGFRSLCHFRMAEIACSTEYIGVPAAMLAGPALPSWRPASGQRANRSTNTITDVAYPFQEGWGVSQIVGAFWYSGGMFAPDLGLYGSVLKGGTAHNAYYGNEIYRHDLNGNFTRMTERHSPLYFHSDVPLSGAHSDTNTGNAELFAAPTGTAVVAGQPTAFQWYNTGVVLPPGVGGAGPNGALLSTVRFAPTPNGADSGVGTRSHIMQLHNPVWERYSTNLISGVYYSQGAACVAPARNKVYLVIGLGTTLRVLDLITREWSTQAFSGMECYGGDYGDLMYMPRHDLVVWLNYPAASDTFSQTQAFVVINPVTFLATHPTTTGTAPIAGGTGSYAWVDDLNKFFVYSFLQPDTLFSLHPPASNLATGVWTWTSETLNGATPALDVAGQPLAAYRRLFWSSKARVLVWLGGPNVPSQVWTPQGA